jgi:hypothetical protein
MWSAPVLLLLVLVAANLTEAAPVAAAQSVATHCAAGQTPGYVFGFANLRAWLGDWMGDPLTCEYADPNGTGDVHQQTTRGLAFWRKRTNTPTFTNGTEHWALVGGGLVYWQGSSIDPRDALAAAPNPCLASSACSPSAPASVARPPVPTTYVFNVVGPPVDSARLTCVGQNPSCSRDAWWIEHNELQDDGSVPVQFSFVGPGLVSERRFVEVIWLLWQWPEGQSLLKQASTNGVAVLSVPGGSDAGAFAVYQPPRNSIIVNRSFAESSTWMVADVIAHELQHAADWSMGLLTGDSADECVAREQRGYQTEFRYQSWLSVRFGGLPTPLQMANANLSNEDYELYINLFRLGTSRNVDALAAADYRRICA